MTHKTGRSSGAGRHYSGRTDEQRTTERRRRLLDAGLELFGTRGFRHVSISDICAAANVSRRSFYEQIGSLENLLMAVVAEIDRRAIAHVQAALAESAAERLEVRTRRAMRAYLSVTCVDIRTARLCYVEVVAVSSTVETWRSVRRETFVGLLVPEARVAAERGEIGLRDFRLTALGVIGAINSLAQEWIAGQTISSAITAPTVADIADELASIMAASLAVDGRRLPPIDAGPPGYSNLTSP